MKAVFIPGPKQVEVRDVPEPEPKDDLVVVKIMSSVICGTEHTSYERGGQVPGAGGHEAAGVVWKTDKAHLVKPGDHVSIYPTIGENCLRCPACMAGEWQLCSSLTRKRSYMGTHTPYLLVPEYVCLPIPEDMPFSTGAMLDDCLGTPYRAIKRSGVRAGETVLITGTGPIGMAALVISKFLNARVIAVEPIRYRLDHASKVGADFILDPNKDDVLAKVKEITGNRGVDFAIDCSGVDSAQVQCLNAVRPGGRAAFVGIRSETTSVNVLRQFILKELTVIGSWASTPQDHHEIIRQIQRGMPVDKLVTHRFGVDDAPEAFRKFFAGEAVKVAIDMWPSISNG